MRRTRGITTSALVLALALAPSSVGAAQEAPKTGRDTVLAGLYSDEWNAGNDLETFGKVSGLPVSLAGTFHTLRESEDGWGPQATGRLLEQAWSAQSTPFANVNVNYTAFEVARGDADADIGNWAARVRGWLDRGEGRSLLIAPMQEMNGNWVPYGMDPGNYRIAFRRFVEISAYYGLDSARVRWVFAPNGWSVPPHTMADYYPGDDIVDFVGVSTYNFGAIVDFWTPVEWAITAAVDEIRTFAPDKPYILAQVGSSTAGGDRDAWLREMFSVANRDPNVVGLVYFNFDKETDWTIWDGNTVAQGWLDGASRHASEHVWPLTGWFSEAPLHFQTHEGSFSDDDLLPARDDVDWLAERGIISGCGVETFCPQSLVTRGQLATLLFRAFELGPATGQVARDDDGSPHEASIDAVVAAGLMELCSPKRFCPSAPATRSVLAAAFDAREEGLGPVTDPHREAGEEICASIRACQKKSLTRTYVAAALRTFLEMMPAPEPEPTDGGERPWWSPPT